MIKNNLYHSGFTLIETIVYLALFAILMTGVLSASFNLFESSGHNASRALLAEEGSFVIAKVHGVLSGATLVTQPSTGSSSSVLSVHKAEGGMVALDPAELVGGKVTLTSISFYHVAAIGTGLTQESVGVRFTLSTRTAQGALLSQDFFSTTSLRK
jgi:prepilin-type N-terminal cleavage/methylation domain-containing protein